MPAFAGNFNWNNGLIWPIGFIDGKTQMGASGVGGRLQLCHGLVDTGATMTCISKTVAADLSLDVVGKGEMHTAGPSVEVNMYHVHVAFIIPLPDMTVSEGTIEEGQMHVINNITAFEFNPPEDNQYHSLIGRDVLSRGILNLCFSSHFSFSI